LGEGKLYRKKSEDYYDMLDCGGLAGQETRVS